MYSFATKPYYFMEELFILITNINKWNLFDSFSI